MIARKREVYIAARYAQDAVYLAIDTTPHDGETKTKEYRPSAPSLRRLHNLLRNVPPARVDFNSFGPALTYRFMGKVGK